MLFHEYKKQPPYLWQIHPCIALFVLQFPLYAIRTAVQLTVEYQIAGNHTAEYQSAGKISLLFPQIAVFTKQKAVHQNR